MNKKYYNPLCEEFWYSPFPVALPFLLLIVFPVALYIIAWLVYVLYRFLPWPTFF